MTSGLQISAGPYGDAALVNFMKLGDTYLWEATAHRAKQWVSVWQNGHITWGQRQSCRGEDYEGWRKIARPPTSHSNKADLDAAAVRLFLLTLVSAIGQYLKSGLTLSRAYGGTTVMDG